MSEHETEPQPETGNDPLEDAALREEQEHPEIDQPEQDGGQEPEPDGDDTLEPGPTDAEQERAIQSERDLMKRDQRLDGEKQRHAKRLGEIMGDAANDLIPCPVCMDGIDGYVYLPEVQQLSDEAISRIRQVIGLPDYSTFEQADDATMCPKCKGLGKTVTGSHVPGYEVKTCGTCKEAGWIPVGAAPTNGAVAHTDEPVVTGPTVFTGESADPEIAHLRQRGFTVIPPMQVQSG